MLNGQSSDVRKVGVIEKILKGIELIGNKLPDPAILFLLALIITWIISALLSPIQFSELDPRNGQPLRVLNLLTGESFAVFLSNMVTTFTSFAPLGVVLVAVLGVGVAENAGYVNAGLKLLLGITPKSLLTPMIILIAIVSHTAVDAGYVIVIPLAGIVYYAAGRHPIAGIAAAFAGVSGGFSANFIPSGIDPLLQGFTQSAAQLLDPGVLVNPLSNWYFTSASTLLIVGLGWFLTDKIVEPRLQRFSIETAEEDKPEFHDLNSKEKKAFWISTFVMILGLIALALFSIPENSPMRDAQGNISSFSAPLMKSIVPLIFLMFVIPGTIYGFVSGSFKKSKDVVDAMIVSMKGMGGYIVMAFFCALFIDAFAKSNLGALLAIKGADFLKAMNLPGQVTIIGIIILTAIVNIFVGSASAKWALLSPIFVPLLMQLGISPELTQAAYRVGDSSTNIITPLLVYFPLIIIFCQKYVSKMGIGTMISIMIPYSVVFMIGWTIFLLIYWWLGIPLGIQGGYVYPN
jgi:aminobenzoyl-glutamate transport protein